MRRHNKGAQTITLDFIIGITIFLSMIVLFYYLFAVDVTKTEEEAEAAKLIDGLSGNSYFDDGELTDDEIDLIGDMDCKELKEFFNTNKNVCLYVTDTNGNIIPLTVKDEDGTSVALKGLGCEGIEIVDGTGQDTICGQE